MSNARRDLYKHLDALDHHARKITALTTQVRSHLAAMSITPPVDGDTGFSCACGVEFLTERHLALHQQNVHGGPPVPLDPHEEIA